ncbi:STAS domain-containing protein [Streptomyces sp. NPDC016845]|uniref:STAS domain-containing protein n=1 Tax=Streptomyces sp. NPDC016845 TaxID=3364972 RepID=UPI0037A61123
MGFFSSAPVWVVSCVVGVLLCTYAVLHLMAVFHHDSERRKEALTLLSLHRFSRSTGENPAPVNGGERWVDDAAQTGEAPPVSRSGWLPGIGQTLTTEDGVVYRAYGHVHIFRTEGWVVLQVASDVDPEYLKLRDAALITIEREKPDKLVVDLSSAPSLNSIALGVLVGILQRSRIRGIDFRLVLSGEDFVKVFRITGLNRIFLLFGSLEDAMVHGE